MKTLVAFTLVLGLVLCLGCTRETKKPGTKAPAPTAGQKEAGKAPAAPEKAAKPEGGPAKEEKAPAKEEKAGEPEKAKSQTPPPAPPKAGEEKAK